MGNSTLTKVVLLGNAGSGKTALMKRINFDKYQSPYISTIGLDFATMERPKRVIQTWDTAGAEGLQSMPAGFNQFTDVVIYCIDLSQPLNINKITSDIQQFKKLIEPKTTEPTFILVGTKIDLDRSVTDQEFTQLLSNKSLGFSKGFKVSSKTNEEIGLLRDGIYEIADELAKAEEKAKMDVPLDSPENKSIAMEKALRQLNCDSLLHEKITNLKNHIAELSVEKQDLIGKHTSTLVNQLKESSDAEAIAQHIQEFENNCIRSIGSSFPKVLAAILGVVVTAVVTLLAAAVGFGIGFAAGAWTGPGAFITGFLAGSAAACAVVATSSVCGAGLGFFAGRGTYNNLMVPNNLVQDVAETAKTCAWSDFRND